ncbi:TPA: hypothetical protein DEP94_03160 [Candidatus Nomurabacteria bacterium]|nr:hypothetical protein [Candidatus Nomurabacteria bacterium]
MELKMKKLMNAFSLNMLADLPAQPLFEEIKLEGVRIELADGFESTVGHPDTADVYTNVIGMKVPCVRSTVSLKKGDVAIIGQYRGPRLPEGAKQLPEGATIQWLRMTV